MRLATEFAVGLVIVLSFLLLSGLREQLDEKEKS